MKFNGLRFRLKIYELEYSDSDEEDVLLRMTSTDVHIKTV